MPLSNKELLDTLIEIFDTAEEKAAGVLKDIPSDTLASLLDNPKDIPRESIEYSIYDELMRRMLKDSK